MAKRRVGSVQRTLKECKRRGWVAGVVERRNPKLANKTHDFLGIIDVIALSYDGEPAIVGVQATMASGRLKHIAKIKESINSLNWIRCRGRLELWSWRRKKLRGKRLHRWVVKVDRFYRDHNGDVCIEQDQP